MSIKILQDSQSPEVCLLLYLLSLEPTLLYDLNEACRDLDESKILALGAYAQVMRVVLNGIGENNKKDAIKKGEVSGKFGPYGFFSESFLLFRGVNMKKEWLAIWL